MQITKGLGLVLCGMVAGWLCQTLFMDDSLSDSTQNTIDPSLAESSANASEKDHQATSLGMSESLVSLSEPIAEINSATFIQDLSLMDRGAFDEYLNGMSNNDIKISKQEMFALLTELPTISDPRTWYRLIDFIGVSRFNGGLDNGRDVENWVIDKIQNANQQSHWLEALAHWGVKTEKSINYLANSLDGLHDTESRVSTLLALSRSHNIERGWIGNVYGQHDNNLVGNKVEAYLNSDVDLERAAAFRVLEQFPIENFAERINTGLDDSSERVRLSAMRALYGHKRPNVAAIKTRLMSRMQASDASDLERLTAWQVLRLMPIDGDHYSAVYEFGAHEQELLNQRYRQSASRKRSQWD